MTNVTVFCCYAREDKGYLQKLRTHLKPLERKNIISVSHDQDITAGSEWEETIKGYLDTAQIILLLVSPDFIASDYCYSVEMTRALERHEQEQVIVIPIIARPTTWQHTPFAKLQVLPPGAKPITDNSWVTQDKALVAITDGISQIALKLQGASTQTQEIEVPLMGQKEAVYKEQEAMTEQKDTDNLSSLEEEPTPNSATDDQPHRNAVLERKAAKLDLIRANLSAMEETIDIGTTNDLREQFASELHKTIRQAIFEIRKLTKNTIVFAPLLEDLGSIDAILQNLRQAKIQVMMAIDAIPSILTRSIFNQQMPEDFYQHLSSCREYLEQALDEW
ncbi:toll/interleukin-1 receptor domain-containing protein [Dictyobacter formicarum]|uniref:TIR domain-containing protein n=1 Tax=Dictyobacter formicarum TaxID=2778368 RepID=A0ABQ3VHJ9_9CHLR|nr:toll/interleukin-1 receptor domain-containing protein [Dictyobacter formicarum]GHO85260.1 hypothetical protein KSZ_32660 [Dictyobacter formicarum]